MCFEPKPHEHRLQNILTVWNQFESLESHFFFLFNDKHSIGITSHNIVVKLLFELFFEQTTIQKTI